MIDSFVRLLGTITKLGEVREKNREKFIDRYVEPVYSDAEAIYKDYIVLLRAVRDKVKRNKKINPILKFLDEKRQENLATRTKVRALLKNRTKEGTLTQFERGIWGLMMGSVTAFDDGHCSFYPIHNGDHTVLNVAKYLGGMDTTDINKKIRKDMLFFINRQIDGIELAWREVVEGYADLVSEGFPKTSLPKKYVYKHEGD